MRSIASLVAVAIAAVAAVSSVDAALGTTGDAKMYGLNYDRRQAPDWDPTQCKTRDQVFADVKAIAEIANSVRVYDISVRPNCHTRDLLEAAKQAGITVALGMWTGKEEQAFEAELADLENLLQNNLIDDNVVGIHVGSEALHRRDYSADTAVKYLKRVREVMATYGQTDLPLTITDTLDKYYSNPQILAAVDYASVNVFPFWEKVDVRVGTAAMLDKLRALRTQAEKLGKQVVLGETGWASDGKDSRTAIVSLDNQKHFFEDFYRQATAQDIPYYWFVAYESPWMSQLPRNESSPVEPYFGVMHADHSLKSSFTDLDLVVPPCVTFKASTGSYLGEAMESANIRKVNGVARLAESSLTTKVQQLQHQWLFDTSRGTIRSLNSDRCLYAEKNEIGAKVSTGTCAEGETKQAWKYDVTAKRVEHAVFTGMCLTNELKLDECSDESASQDWDMTNLSAPAMTEPPATTAPAVTEPPATTSPVWTEPPSTLVVTTSPPSTEDPWSGATVAPPGGDDGDNDIDNEVKPAPGAGGTPPATTGAPVSPPGPVPAPGAGGNPPVVTKAPEPEPEPKPAPTASQPSSGDALGPRPTPRASNPSASDSSPAVTSAPAPTTPKPKRKDCHA